MKKTILVSLLSTTLILSACGGGGGSEEPSDKYVGTLLSKCHSYVASNGNTYYRKLARVNTKTSAGELATTQTQTGYYGDGACANSLGSNVNTYNSGKYNLGKSTTFLGATADEMVYTDVVTNIALPGFMTASGNQWNLVTYAAGAPVPTGWSFTSPFTKQ